MKVPAYIVTFSDMVTLLLTFFVMLISMANFQVPSLVQEGRNSFVQSLELCGLGMLFTKEKSPQFDYELIKHYIEQADHVTHGRTIDARQEELRRLYDQISENSKTMQSRIDADSTHFSVMDVHFDRGSLDIVGAKADSLLRFCNDLDTTSGGQTLSLYVLGIANESARDIENWQLSARRAKAVADFLRENSAVAKTNKIFSWGAGTGGNWVGKDSPFSETSEILIALLRTDDQQF